MFIMDIFPKDDKRLQQLYDVFYPRDMDENGYDDRMNFWQNAIKMYCEEQGKATFSTLELQQFFTHKNNKPKCLPAVIQFLSETNQIRELEAYEYDPLNSWFGGRKNGFLKHFVLVGLKKLKRTLNFRNQNDSLGIVYVHVAVLNKFCELLVKNVIDNLRGNILFYKYIRTETEFRMPQITEDSLKLCLYTLFHQRIIGISQPQNLNLQSLHLIKIPGNNESSDFGTLDIENALRELETTKTSLQSLIKRIEIEMKDNEYKMLSLVEEDNEDLAETYSKKSRMLENSHTLLRCHVQRLSSIDPQYASDQDSGVTGTIDDENEQRPSSEMNSKERPKKRILKSTFTRAFAELFNPEEDLNITM